MSQIFGPIVLIHFVHCGIVICAASLMFFFLAEGPETMMYLSYIMGYTTDTFIYTLSGTMLYEASAKVSEAAYNFEWYKCDKRIQRLILLVTIRAQQRTVLKVPFFNTSLETFITVKIYFFK